MNDEDPKKFDKFFNLEDTEYRKSDEPEPFWGPGGKDFAVNFVILLIVGMATSAVLGRIIYGEFPYWLRPLLG